MTVPYVREAFALLNKSIIRVEQPDINLEEAEEHVEVPASAAEGDAAMEVDNVGLFSPVKLQLVMR